ncbi:MAG: hypothetical protein WD492_06095 [Alkalispirochaeta sp.]
MQRSNLPIDGFDPEKAFARIDAFGDSRGKTEAIIATLETYREARDNWRQVLANHPDGLVRERVSEYAEVLHCEPKFRAVTHASFNLLQAWPQRVAPNLKARLRILSIGGNPEILERASSWLDPSDLFWFNSAETVAYARDIEDRDRRLGFLITFKEKVVTAWQSGRLVLIDPQTGFEVDTDADSYETMLNKAVGQLLVEIQNLELSTFLKSRKAGEKPATSPHYEGKILWRASVEKLTQLMTTLYAERLIECDKRDLLAIITEHFRDLREPEYELAQIANAMMLKEPPSESSPCDKIFWKGSLVELTYLFLKLVEMSYFSHVEGELIKLLPQHFFDKNGKPVNERSLGTSKSEARGLGPRNNRVRRMTAIIDELLKNNSVEKK